MAPNDVIDGTVGVYINADGPAYGEFRYFSAIVPSPGDFDLDGILSLNDIDELQVQIRNGTAEAIYDVNRDGSVTRADVDAWVQDLKQTWFGDANLDGEFNSGDLVRVFQSGKYETGEHAGWSDGDWNGDGLFDSGDLVVAFQDSGYEKGPRVAANAVPEPSVAVLLLSALMAIRARKNWLKS